MQLGRRARHAFSRLLAIHHSGSPDGSPIYRLLNSYGEQDERVEQTYAVAITISVGASIEARCETALTDNRRRDGERRDGLPALADSGKIEEPAEWVTGWHLFELGNVRIGEDQSPSNEPSNQTTAASTTSAICSEHYRIQK